MALAAGRSGTSPTSGTSALIDSGATDIFVREVELLDPASLVRLHEGEGGTVETAAGEAEIKGRGALFAVVADERGEQAIIRAPALCGCLDSNQRPF